MPTTTTPVTPDPTTVLRLEGPDLDSLLAQVSDELGPEAVIVEANKLRSGGLGGFFAKEAYEVVVNVPEAADTEPGGLDALIEAASAGDAAPQPEVPLEPASATPPRMSTETVGFAGVLDRMVRDAGVELRTPRAVGPVARAMSEAPADDDAPFEPLQPAAMPHVPPPAAAAAPAPLPARVPAAAPAHPVLDQRWLARVGVPPGLAVNLGAIRSEPIVELLRLMEQVTPAPMLPREQGSVIAVAGPRAEALHTAELLADELDLDPAEILIAAESFRGGSIPQDRRITRAEAAGEQRRSWRRRRTPTIVAVDAGIGRIRGSWAQNVVDALEPTMVWGVVEATRKPEDIRGWAERLGGLDALAVTDLAGTVSPATVLGAGVPVGLLDDRPASPSRWTALLAEQLELAA